MTNKRYLLIVIGVILFLFGLPASAIAFDSPLDNGVRVIPLSASGKDSAYSVAFSPEGKRLAVGTSSGILFINSQVLSRERFISTEVGARSVAFSPDGQIIAAGLFDGTARFWRVSDGQELLKFGSPVGWVRSIAFTPDGKLFAVATDDDTIRLWNSADGSLKLTIPNLPGLRVLALSPDGELLAAGLQNAEIQLLNVSDGSLVKTLKRHEDWVRSLAFSPDGKILASGAFDAKAILWDVETGQVKFKLDGHQSSVLGVSFSPDGKTLGSGSVDGTVKLWNVTDGSLLHTLVGHTDFVYGVSFSPDGTTIASGSSDNSVRLWDVAGSDFDQTSQPPTPSDCRACHHPRGTGAPPRVIQMSCKACHAGGIGLNWCAFFKRSDQAVTKASYFPITHPVGVPVSSENVAVRINYPTNGETLYTSGHNLAPVFIKGRVFYAGNFQDINVRMEIWSGEQPAGTLFAHPDQDGDFTFNLAINPDGASILAGAKAADPDCATCHEGFQSQASLPDGQVHFVVTAILPGGEQAFDERWLTVDTSARTKVEVHVVDKKSGSPISGLPVRAATILYEWRNRYINQVSDTGGIASMSFEILSQAVTRYEITVPPSSLNGYLYKGTAPVILDLPAGALNHEPVTIYVEASTGQINGSLNVAEFADPPDIWAIHLPDGAFYKTSASNGSFQFDNLPSGEYRVFVDPSVNQSGFRADPLLVNLTREAKADASIELQKTETFSISGRVQAVNGAVLPFGRLTAASKWASQPDPVKGNYQLSGLVPNKFTLIADAPGYYSQAKVIDLTGEKADNIDFSLVLRPETTIRAWGDGKVILPPETIYTENGDSIKLVNGWVWGQSNVEAGLNFQVAGMQISLTRGSFALKYQPSQDGWFTLTEGEAVIQTAGGEKLLMGSGQMLRLSDQYGPIPVPYEEKVFMALQPEHESPLYNKWEPSLDAQIRDRLAQMGINFMQLVTFVTYIVVLVLVAGFFIGGIYSTWKYIRKLTD